MANPLVVEGLSDAIGFVGGALMGYWAANIFGLDIFAKGYDSASMIGIVLVGVGGGFGLKMARSWRASRKPDTEE